MNNIYKLYSDDFYKEKANEVFEKGLENLSLNEYSVAYSYFKKAIELNPTSDTYHFFAGLSSYYFQEKKASGYFEKAAAISMDKIDYQLWYGISLYREERFLEAKKVLEYALSLDDENEKTILYLFKTLNRIGYYDDVIKNRNQFLSIKESSSDILYEIGYAYVKEFKFEQAINTLLESIEKDRKNIMPYYLLSRTYCKTGDFNPAIETLKKLAFEVKTEEELVKSNIEAIKFLQSF